MIKTLDELTAFLKICRKQGVSDIKFDGVSVAFGDLPKKRKDEASEDSEEIQTDGLTDEQMMDYHINGLISNENNAR